MSATKVARLEAAREKTEEVVRRLRLEISNAAWDANNLVDPVPTLVDVYDSGTRTGGTARLAKGGKGIFFTIGSLRVVA